MKKRIILAFLLITLINFIVCNNVNAEETKTPPVACTYTNVKGDGKINTKIYSRDNNDDEFKPIVAYDENGNPLLSNVYYGNNTGIYFAPVTGAIDRTDMFVTDATSPGSIGDTATDWKNLMDDACPPYFFIFEDDNASDYVGLFSDRDEIMSQYEKGEKSIIYQAYKSSDDSSVDITDDGKIVPKAEKYTCNYDAKLMNQEIKVGLTISITEHLIYTNYGVWHNLEEYQKNFLFEKDNCPSDLYVCNHDAFMEGYGNEYATVKRICSEADFKNGTCLSSAKYCTLLVNNGEKDEVGVNACLFYVNRRNEYVEDLAKDNMQSVKKIRDQVSRFCRSVVSNQNYNVYEYSCINLCLNYKEDFFEIEFSKGECGLSEKIILWIGNIIRWVKYIIPVAVIILGILDFIKSISGDKEDEMKKAQQRFIRRLIAAALIFIIPFIIEFILVKFGFDANSCGIINL